MAEFTTPTDIGNRAAQHCGAEMMDPVLGFTEISKIAKQVSSVYGKLRQAELERNVWTFATRRAALRAIDTDTMLLVPSAWVSTTVYFNGSIVDDGSETLWISRTQNNTGNQPQNSATWEPYFGPMTVSLYDSATTYYSGELVYTAAGDGTYRVYLSRITGNSDNPATATSWAAATTYNTADIITYLSVAYQSLIDLNIGQIPSASPAVWSSSTSYTTGQHVYSTADGLVYSSVGNGNLNNDPATDSGVNWTNTGVLCAWTKTFTSGTGSINWLEIGGAEFPTGVGLTTMNIVYPLGSSPAANPTTLNVYRKPAGFLRAAPQDPKAGSASWLGAPTNSIYNDWLYEGDFILTRCVGVIVLRFVADVQDVSKMKPLFCECLAAQIALAICEPMTNLTTKLTTIAQILKKKESEAITINAIEAGSEESPLDDWIACRG